MEEWIDRLLIGALDYGVSELEFWEMTPGEIVRLTQSRARVRRLEAQEKASYDYILASLIVKGIGITLGSKETYPTIENVYPGLFDDLAEKRNEEIANKKISLSALRFRQFAQSYNDKFKKQGGAKKLNE